MVRSLMLFWTSFFVAKEWRQRRDQRAQTMTPTQVPTAPTGAVHLPDGRFVTEFPNGEGYSTPRYPLSGRAAKPAKVTRVPSPWGGSEVLHDDY